MLAVLHLGHMMLGVVHRIHEDEALAHCSDQAEGHDIHVALAEHMATGGVGLYLFLQALVHTCLEVGRHSLVGMLDVACHSLEVASHSLPEDNHVVACDLLDVLEGVHNLALSHFARCRPDLHLFEKTCRQAADSIFLLLFCPSSHPKKDRKSRGHPAEADSHHLHLRTGAHDKRCFRHRHLEQ